MELELEDIREIAYEYQFPKVIILKYYELIKDYPCVVKSNKQNLIDCLYLIVQDRVSMNYIVSLYDGTFPIDEFKREKYKSLKYSISDALYRIYDEEAIPDLCDKYKYIKRL